MTLFAEKNKGIAIISAMVVITMVASTTSWLLYGQNLAVNKLTRIVAREQAFLLALGAEARAVELLERDGKMKAENSVDYYAIPKDKTRNEEWSWSFDAIAPGFADDAATVDWCLYDLLAFINLNNVYSETRGIKGDRNWTSNRLAMAFNLRSDDIESPQELINSLLDWFDANNTPRSEGAENSYYQSLDPPYVTSKLRMAWPSEVRLVKGFSRETAALFLPFLSALPSPGKITPINVNTAPREVLLTLPGITPAVVGELVAWREETAFTSGEQFWQVAQTLQGISNQATPKWVNQHLDVKSNFFLAAINVKTGDTSLTVQSFMTRPLKEPRTVSVLQRRFGKISYEDCARRKSRLKNEEDDLDQT